MSASCSPSAIARHGEPVGLILVIALDVQIELLRVALLARQAVIEDLQPLPADSAAGLVDRDANAQRCDLIQHAPSPRSRHGVTPCIEDARKLVAIYTG
jgi:hypothetical protein